MGDTQSRQGTRLGFVPILSGILVFGSIWGLLEATLGGYLHLILFPNKGAIMSGIGMATMGVALAYYRKPGMLPGIGIVAASFKLLDIWLFAVPVGSVHIINPAMAIIFEALAFGLVAGFMMDRIAKRVYIVAGAGALVGIISATAYVYFAIYVMNAHLLGRVITTAGAFIANQGLVQAAFCGTFLPLGFLAGEKLVAKSSPLLASRALYYATSGTVICLCWTISAIAKTVWL